MNQRCVTKPIAESQILGREHELGEHRGTLLSRVLPSVSSAGLSGKTTRCLFRGVLPDGIPTVATRSQRRSRERDRWKADNRLGSLGSIRRNQRHDFFPQFGPPRS
jgi:hypothetical protein